MHIALRNAPGSDPRAFHGTGGPMYARDGTGTKRTLTVPNLTLKYRLSTIACTLIAVTLAIAPAAGASGEGFLSTEFVNDSAVADEGFRDLLYRIDLDSLAANIQHLQNYGTRYAYTTQVVKAGKWLMRRFAGFGYVDTLYQSVAVSQGKVQLPTGNAVATKPGRTRPEYRVIVGSHYDSITFNQAVPPSESAPGADDNASGTSAMLEIARLLFDQDLDATVQFVSTTGHEVGMLGSYEFVRFLVEEEEVPQDKLFFLNLDMIGNADGRKPWRVTIHDNVPSRPLAELAARIGMAYTGLIPQMAGVRMADHTPYHEEGYRAVFLHEGDFNLANYHSVTDLLENVEIEYVGQVTEMAMAIVLHFARLSDPPSEVSAVQTGTDQIRVSWNHATDADVVGYHVEVLDGDGRLSRKAFTRENFLDLDTAGLDPGATVRVRSEDLIGEGEASAPVLVGTGDRLSAYVMPNPTTGPCRFDVFVPGDGPPVNAALRVIDAAGRLVAVAHDAPLERGSNLLRWSGMLQDGSTAPHGVYFYSLEVEGLGAVHGKIMMGR